MKAGRTRLWIAACSTLAVVAMAVVDLGRTAPGPLSAVHGREPDLSGRHDCSECHGGWRRTMAEACMDCHESIESDIRDGKGLHGAIGRDQVATCSRCHSEHHGVGFATVNRRSFQLAGVPDPGEFDHGQVGFEMSGEHLELECRRCHANADAAILARGEARYGGLRQDCATCHEDVHKGAMEVACAACHGQEDWKVLHAQGHERFLPLVGGHERLDCRRCHGEQDAHALEIVGGAGRKPPPRDCAACHDSPHSARFVERIGRMRSLAPGASCVVCHEAEHTAFRDVRIELTPQLHAASGFALGVPHDQVGCEKCHDPRAETFAARYPGRGQDDCASCHQDPHGGQFATGPFSTAGCVGCHDRERFEPHAFSRELHERAVLPLEGRHAELECSACHAKPREDAPRVFRGTPVRCVDCHEDAHRGFFEAHGGTNEDGEPLSCSVCHGATAFDAIEPGAFDHAQRTGFAVREAHAQEACTSCHPLADEPDHAGRRFGRVSEHFGPYRGCVSCHEDPHEGAFDAPGMSAEVDGRRDCARCHQESSFRAFPDGFEHGRWTGFELKGDHAMAACTACHAPLRTPDAQGRTWARATGSACADCHDDVHQGQLARDGRTDCARCHTDGSSFELVAFDHERDARFALGEAHGQLACSACHAEEPTPDGGRLVRYRPLPTGCADCHGIHDQPLLRHRRGGR